MDSFDAQSRGGIGAKLTKKERTAVSTALFGIGGDACDKLLEYCYHHGVTKKTAFSIDTMQTPAWFCGYSPPDVSDKWKSLLKTTEDSVRLCMDRMIKDNISLPDGMRKNVSSTEAAAMLLNANLLMNSLSMSSTEIPTAAYTELKKYSEEPVCVVPCPYQVRLLVFANGDIARRSCVWHRLSFRFLFLLLFLFLF